MGVGEPDTRGKYRSPPPSATGDLRLPKRKRRAEKSARRFCFLMGYFLQHFAQPAASVQHLAHFAWSLQQEPLQAAAALVQEPEPQEPQLLQPEVNNSPAAQTAPSISIFILFFLSSWAGSLALPPTFSIATFFHSGSGGQKKIPPINARPAPASRATP
jgi:hypothetical protein